jgi:hypothetical protein
MLLLLAVQIADRCAARAVAALLVGKMQLSACVCDFGVCVLALGMAIVKWKHRLVLAGACC